jgi:hypothetical protein
VLFVVPHYQSLPPRCQALDFEPLKTNPFRSAWHLGYEIYL